MKDEDGNTYVEDESFEAVEETLKCSADVVNNIMDSYQKKAMAAVSSSINGLIHGLRQSGMPGTRLSNALQDVCDLGEKTMDGIKSATNDVTSRVNSLKKRGQGKTALHPYSSTHYV